MNLKTLTCLSMLCASLSGPAFALPEGNEYFGYYYGFIGPATITLTVTEQLDPVPDEKNGTITEIAKTKTSKITNKEIIGMVMEANGYEVGTYRNAKLMAYKNESEDVPAFYIDYQYYDEADEAWYPYGQMEVDLTVEVLVEAGSWSTSGKTVEEPYAWTYKDSGAGNVDCSVTFETAAFNGRGNAAYTRAETKTEKAGKTEGSDHTGTWSYTETGKVTVIGSLDDCPCTGTISYSIKTVKERTDGN
jgi:hypothetical protein